MSSVIIVSTCQLGAIKSEGGHYKQLRGSVWPLTGAWPSEAWAGGGGGQPVPSERGGRLGQCSQDGVGRQQQGSRHDQTST